ncbi:hypothetical protein L1887_32662 [Cichorium endivia]|nr:hypothetical protein L1887_32662 [Cichorium endivia]
MILILPFAKLDQPQPPPTFEVSLNRPRYRSSHLRPPSPISASSSFVAGVRLLHLLFHFGQIASSLISLRFDFRSDDCRLQNGDAAPGSKSRIPQMVASSLGFGQKHDATVDIPLDSMNVRRY